MGWFFVRPIRSLRRYLNVILNGHPSNFVHLISIIGTRQTLIIVLQYFLRDIMEVWGREIDYLNHN